MACINLKKSSTKNTCTALKSKKDIRLLKFYEKKKHKNNKSMQILIEYNPFENVTNSRATICLI
jgi:hypothetical protein